MIHRSMIPVAFMVLIAPPVGADPTSLEIELARSACRDAFLSRDPEAYRDAAAKMIEWGEITNSDWAREVELCLAFANVLDGVDLEDLGLRAAGQVSPETDPLGVSPAEPGNHVATDARLADFLARVRLEGGDIGAVAAEIAADEAFGPPAGAERDALEAALTAYVRPIPASQREQNLIAYRALARVNPENTTYRERILRYEQAIEAERAQLDRTARQLEGRLVRTTAAFDGSSWARHPSSPRYQDTRDYITLYLIESGTGQKSMELFVNYTSRDGWLFVQNASINIDGETARLPINQWFRDNDTEIWEFGSVRGDTALALARRIAAAERVVIRFNGQQFYDDYVVSDTDKRVIREMLAMWDVISAQ